MKNLHSHSRRLFIKAAGVSLALPWLETFSSTKNSSMEKIRLFTMSVPFGFEPTYFIPTEAGSHFTPPPHLKIFDQLRNDYTVISGLSHPETAAGSHNTERVIFTGAPYPNQSHNLKNTISVDQALALNLRGQTRLESLVLTTYRGNLSYSANGVGVPAINHPKRVYSKLFDELGGSRKETKVESIKRGQSILDKLSDATKLWKKRISKSDQGRLDEYYSSLRDVERQLEMSMKWLDKPKPKKIGKAPDNYNEKAPTEQKLKLMLDMAYLAILTDSTRVFSMQTIGAHHTLSHHGKEKEKLEKFEAVNTKLLTVVNSFLEKLKKTTEGEKSLLDKTMFLLTSNLRDGNTHWTHDLPVFLAGGGFKHGSHIAFNKPYLEQISKDKVSDKAAKKPVKSIPIIMGQNQAPLCNLYTSMLQRAGVEINKFSSASGTLRGLTW